MQPFTFSSILKAFALNCILALLIVPCFAQIKLPEVPKTSDDRTEIKGTYIPHGNFLKNNPNFMKDGAYFFNTAVNSETFPANAEESSKTLSGFGKIILQFIADTSLSFGFPVSGYYIQSKTFLDNKGFNIWGADLTKEHKTLNEIYKQSAKEILLKKSVDSFSICDAASVEFDKTSFSNSNIIFQFDFVAQNISWKNKGSDDFPSNLLCKLIVKNVSGEIIKNYGQAIFFEGSAHNAFKTFRNLVLTVTLPIAIENLINKFLNDEKTVQIAKAIIGDAIAAKNIDPHQDSLYTYKQQYNYIRSKKQQLLLDLSLVKSRFISIANQISQSQSNVANRDRTLDNNLLTSLISNTFMGNNGEIKRQLKGAQQALDGLKQSAFLLNQEEIKFIQEAGIAFDNTFDIPFIFYSKETDDNKINAMISELSNQKSETSIAFQKMSDFVKGERVSGFSNGINSFMNTTTGSTSTIPSTTSSTPQAETMATTNGGNMDACQQKATREYYKSSEYRNWQTRKLQSDAYDAQAKMCDLTLQYCSDKLPPSDIVKIKKARDDARKVADQIRSANKFYIKP